MLIRIRFPLLWNVCVCANVNMSLLPRGVVAIGKSSALARWLWVMSEHMIHLPGGLELYACNWAFNQWCIKGVQLWWRWLPGIFLPPWCQQQRELICYLRTNQTQDTSYNNVLCYIFTDVFVYVHTVLGKLSALFMIIIISSHICFWMIQITKQKCILYKEKTL